MHPQLTVILAQQHIADLHRAADHHRLVHAATGPPAAMQSPYPATLAPRLCRFRGGSAAWLFGQRARS
jgi:hypothetical protein